MVELYRVSQKTWGFSDEFDIGIYIVIPNKFTLFVY